MTEAELQADIIALARYMGWLVYHTHDSRRSAKGFPDLCMVRGDRLLFVEIKSAKGKTTPEQDDWLRSLCRTQAEVYLVAPCDWDSGQIERLLALNQHGGM